MTKSGAAGTFLTVVIDRAEIIPLHQQIADELRRAIKVGRLRSGLRLPSSRALATDWGVSRNTVLAVFDTLTGEGLLDSRVGDGTYVRTAPPVQTEPEEGDAEVAVQETASRRGDYPFRSVSPRGRRLIGQFFGGLSERPVAFMPDVPNLRAFPMRSWLRVMNEVSGRLKGNLLVDVPNAGYEPLRQAIVHHLAVTRRVECDASQVIITTGSQQSVDLVSRLLLEAGDPVWVEEPGYFGARAALRANGCALLYCPADEDGLDVECGRRELPAPRMIVVSPSRHYPLGGQLSAPRREALLAFSGKCGSWVLEDDYDCEFRYAGPLPPALKSQDRLERVLLMGTFSKTLLPSFRLGFIVVPGDLAADFAKARAVIDRHAPILEQMVLAEFMHRGLYAAHLRGMPSLYHKRQQTLVASIEESTGYRPPSTELSGGMHIVLPLQPGSDDRAVAHALREVGAIARPLSLYYSTERRRSGLLLGYAAFTPEEIIQAGGSLRRVTADSSFAAR